MTTFKAELFIFTIIKPVYTIEKFPKFAWQDIMRQICQWKNSVNNFSMTPISSYTYSNNWNLSGSHSQLWQHCLKSFRGPLVDLVAIKNTHYQPIQWEHTQCNKFCVKLVLKRCDDLIYIKIKRFFKFLQNSNIPVPNYNQPRFVINWFVSDLT